MWRLFVRPNLCRQARAERGAGRSANSPDRLTYQRALFRTLVMDAYGVQRDQIGGPVWATADASDGGALFDVSAKVPEGATKEQVAAMLQNLLKERFKLSVHREQTQNAGYALVVAKGGSRLKDSAGPPEESERNQTIRASQPPASERRVSGVISREQYGWDRQSGHGPHTIPRLPVVRSRAAVVVRIGRSQHRQDGAHRKVRFLAGVHASGERSHGGGHCDDAAPIGTDGSAEQERA
jgi:uncharacterized protein (TIGR03435 family)